MLIKKYLLQVFLYMSTIFSHTDHERRTIVEQLYPNPKSMDEVYKMVQENDPKETFNPQLLSKYFIPLFTNFIDNKHDNQLSDNFEIQRVTDLN